MAYKSKKDQAAAARRHYLNNKEKIKARAVIGHKKSFKRNKEYVKAHLEKSPCIDCGISDIRVLEFDHVRGVKHKNISDLSKHGASIKKLQEEIDKCEVRCANCHRIKTHETLWVNE